MGKKQIEQSVYIHEKDLNKQSSIESEYQFQKRIQHKDLGKIDLFIHPSTREVLFKKNEIFSEKLEALYAIDFFKRLKSLQSEFVLTLKDYSVKTDSGLCSTSYIVSAYYPFKNKTLFKHLQEIIKIQKDLTEIELLQILYSILQAIQDLKNQGITVHDICPNRIYFDSQTLQTQLILCDQLTNYELDECKSFQLKKIMEQQDLFVSPLLYQNLKQNNINFYLDQDKENSFALGLTLLQAGIDSSVQDVYANQQEINIPKLQNHIENFKWKYEPRSTLLYQCVLNLLQSSHSQRITPESLQSKIPPYNQMKPFLIPNYLNEAKGNPYVQGQNPFNNLVEKSSGMFFNPLKESYMTIQNVSQNQQNAFTGINRGVFDKLENQNSNQKVVGFQLSNQQNNYHYGNNNMNLNQNVNYQFNQQPAQQIYHVNNQPYAQNFNTHPQINQQPIQQNNTIDYFDVSYDKPQQKQNVFYAPLNDKQNNNKFQKNYQKQLSTYSNLFQTQEFLEVTQTPDNIKNKEKQIQELHQYQKKQQKYSYQRFNDDSQQYKRNHSQNKIVYQQNTNQGNPLVYVYNQQTQQYQQTHNYPHKQFSCRNILIQFQIKKQCKKKLDIHQKKKTFQNQYWQKSIGINKKKINQIRKNQYIPTQQIKKRLVEYYDAIKDPIKFYFMDKMQNVLFYLHSNQDQNQIQDINLPKKNSNFINIIKDFSLLKEKFQNCENFTDMRQNQRRRQRHLIQTLKQESNKENIIINQIDQSKKIHERKQSLIMDQLRNQQVDLQERLHLRRQRSMSKSKLSGSNMPLSQQKKKIKTMQNFKLDLIANQFSSKTKQSEYYQDKG